MDDEQRESESECVYIRNGGLSVMGGVKGLRTTLLRQTAVGVVDLTDVCVCVCEYACAE